MSNFISMFDKMVVYIPDCELDLSPYFQKRRMLLSKKKAKMKCTYQNYLYEYLVFCNRLWSKETLVKRVEKLKILRETKAWKVRILHQQKKRKKFLLSALTKTFFLLWKTCQPKKSDFSILFKIFLNWWTIRVKCDENMKRICFYFASKGGLKSLSSNKYFHPFLMIRRMDLNFLFKKTSKYKAKTFVEMNAIINTRLSTLFISFDF